MLFLAEQAMLVVEARPDSTCRPSVCWAFLSTGKVFHVVSQRRPVARAPAAQGPHRQASEDQRSPRGRRETSNRSQDCEAWETQVAAHGKVLPRPGESRARAGR